MNPYVRERISRKLDTLTDERLYQVLDYVEFLETKYAEKPATVVNVFQRFAEGVEDKMRSGGIAVGTISDTMSFLNKTMGVLNGVAQSTMSVANDVVNAAKTAADQVGAPPAAAGTASSAAAGTVSGPVAGPPPPPSPPATPSAPPTAA
jgi:prophage DNA circulation protein